MRHAILFLLLTGACAAATLEVGPGKQYTRIEDAVAKAQAGDTIVVYPLDSGQPYKRVALQIHTPDLTIKSAQGRIRIDGSGYDYSGAGRIPRAIVQFDPEANGCILAGFTLCNARNASHNGAGVRINQASRITIRECDIHDNQMGIMSNGSLAQKTASDLLIESCSIHGNGASDDPGQSHNLYLGGTSVTIRACEIFGSTVGHNIKSRAHSIRIEYCWIHDANDRELDLVDEKGNTDASGSNAEVFGCIIVKKPNTAGNKAVIHFGQDGGGDHTGYLSLIHNTIVTPYQTPVLDLSAPGASANLVGNLISDNGAGGAHTLVNARNGASLDRVTGNSNWLAYGFTDLPTLRHTTIADRGATITFADPRNGDYTPTSGAMTVSVLEALALRQYKHPLTTTIRSDTDHRTVGAFAMR